MDLAREMEDKVGESKDPSLLTKDPLYSSYGPVALCSKIQEEYHVNCRRLSGWPALTTRIPAANNVTDTISSGDRIATNGEATPDTSGSNRNANGTGTGNGNGNSTNDDFSLRSRAWKYIWPHDENQEITVNGTLFKFCKYCRCRHTRRVGFYVTTHSTSTHQGRRFHPDGSTSHGQRDNTNNCNASNSTPSSSSPSNGRTGASSDTTAAQGNHSPVTTAASTSDSRHVDTDPDGLFFEGAANMVETVSNDSALWLSPDLVDSADSSELWMAPAVSEADTASVHSPSSAEAAPALNQTWYRQFCLAPGSPYCQCAHECGGVNFIRPEELPSSHGSPSVSPVEDLDFPVTVAVSADQLALLLGASPSAVPLAAQPWQTSYDPYVGDDDISEAESHPSVSTCAFDCCKADGPPRPSWWKRPLPHPIPQAVCFRPTALLPAAASTVDVSAVVEEEEEEEEEEGELSLSLSALHLDNHSDNSKSSTSVYASCYAESFDASSTLSPADPDPFFDCAGSIFPLGVDGLPHPHFPDLFSSSPCTWWPLWFLVLSFGIWLHYLGSFLWLSACIAIHNVSHLFATQFFFPCFQCGSSFFLAYSMVSWDNLEWIVAFWRTIGAESPLPLRRYRRFVRFKQPSNAIVIHGYPRAWILLSMGHSWITH